MQIHWVNPGVFHEEVRNGVEARIRELTQGHTDIIDVRITARPNGHHRHGGHEVRITCEARGRELVAARSRPDIQLALSETMDVFERELRRLRERRDDPREKRERPGAPAELGVVDRVPSGADHGFSLTDAGERVYFHRNALQGGLEFEKLEEGQRVALDIEGGDNGPQATVVRPAPAGVG